MTHLASGYRSGSETARKRWLSLGRLGVLFAVAVMLMLGATAPASAAKARIATGLGPIPAAAFVQSRCAGMSFGPHAVHLGRQITGNAGPAVDACGPGGVKAISWGWSFYNGLANVGRCSGLQPAKCTFTATTATGTPGHRFTYGCINGNSGFGGWMSCDYYAVIGKDKRALTGTVLDPQGKGVRNAVVSIHGPGGAEQAITDATGTYSAVLDPGSYSVSVSGAGAQATRCSPGSASGARCSVDLNRADGAADFAVCGSPSSANTASGAQAASNTACPLKVFVKVVGPIANVGTRSGLALDNGLPNLGPVNFTVPTYSRSGSSLVGSNEVGQKCKSGCANLLVTVIDPQTHKPAAGATVGARLGEIDTQSAPGLHQQGHQFLCPQTDTAAGTQCATDLQNLTTDQSGRVRLIYWAPGEVVSAHTDITVSASTTCSASMCVAGRKAKSVTAKLTVKPYLIYQHTGELARDEVDLLIRMVRNPALFDFVNAADHEIIVAELEWLAHQELIGQQVVQAASGPFGYGVFFVIDLANAFDEYHEELGLIATFLRAIDLPAIGLDDDPFEQQIPAVPNPTFEQDLLHGAANVGHFAAGGVLWDLAEGLSDQYKGRPLATQPEQVHVSVYETSSCNQRDPRCGPGYSASPGIQPRLCFHVTASNRVPGSGFFHDFCIAEYDALAWTETQAHLNRALP